VARSLESQYAKRLRSTPRNCRAFLAVDRSRRFDQGCLLRRDGCEQSGVGLRLRRSGAFAGTGFKDPEGARPGRQAKICDMLLQLADYLNTAGEPKRALDAELQEAFRLPKRWGMGNALPGLAHWPCIAC